MVLRKTWKILPPAPKNFCQKFPGISRIVLNLLYHRIPEARKGKRLSQSAVNEFFNPDYQNNLHDPFLMKDMRRAGKRILKAVREKEKIAIFGDYDVDGITSVVILYDTLRQIHAQPIVYIPDRQKEGYGLNISAFKYLKKQGINLIITVDCGIRNTKEIEKARQWGMDVIVTDHHLPDKKLPPAFAVVNPHCEKDYPFSELSGAGVAFKLALALIKLSRPKNFPTGFDKWLLDLAALGTIADMVPLIGENRILVKFGLLVLGKTRRLGIKAVFSAARMPLSGKIPPETSQISFQIAPRLNAAGRMDHANLSFALLISEKEKEAREIAEELERKNSRRQRLTEKIVAAIEDKLNSKEKLVFMGSVDWPVGVLGLVAGKICEKYARPAFLFNIGKKECRGSIRSISKFKVVPVLEKCRDLLTDYGGHDYAGGFTFPLKNRQRLLKRLQNIANKLLKYEDLAWETRIDGRISLSEINWNLLEAIKQMEPFGVGNPTPLFLAEKVELFQCQLVGNGNKHLKMWFRAGDTVLESIGFGKGDKYCMLMPEQNPKLDIVFEIGSDEWNGQRKLQLIVRDLRLSP
ncbi:MAG: single-stranded-DNA-specific exonuclease RecJ [Candidatus Moranbacteria bacterium]|nr:single-stranded-DNA-specific exonuclease RecJ [Candidatus Moranbacteria bacterium]